MRVLISAVGDTDPFRNFHDGALIHIARKYRPEKVILIFSEHTAKKQGNIEKALFSIAPNYEPELIIHDPIISDNEVHIFDVMFQRFSDILQEYYTKEDEFILNLSSATPQIKSALFVINRLNGINVKAVKVSSPEHASNENIGHDNDENIDELIKVNFIDRTIEDNAEKFSQALLKKTARDFIEKFDYKAALDILDQLSDFPNLKSLREEIRDVVNCLSKKKIAYIREKLYDFSRVFKNQSILSDILSFPLDDSQKKALNYYLMIDVLKEREHIADVLIKAKSLAEFVIEEIIKKDHEGLIVFDGNLPKLNPSFPDCEAILDDIDKKMKKSRGIEDTEERIFSVQSTLNLLSYLNILEFYEYDSQLQTAINGILSLNGERNKVAHGLSEIDTRLLSRKKLKQLSENLRLLLVDCLGIDSSYFNYYDKQNKELTKMLE